MNASSLWTRCLLGTVLGALFVSAASAQVVRFAAIIKEVPSQELRVPGPSAPPSDPELDGSIVYVELWVTLAGQPANGLACAYADLSYSPTELIDATEPARSNPVLPIEVVPASFDDGAGEVRDLGGCQDVSKTLDLDLGIGEWVMFKRVRMIGIARGGPVTLNVQPSGSLFAGTAIIGDPFPVDSADISVEQAPTFDIVMPIPTVTDWGLAVMALSVLAAGTVMIVRRGGTLAS